MQVPLEIVHAKTFAPVPRFKTEVVGELASAKVPEPEINVQIPVPIVAVFPAKVAVAEQIV